LYAIKNITQFIESCRREETVPYGTGFSFSHRRGVFDPAGQKLLDFITREETLYIEVGKQIAKQFTVSRRTGAFMREMPINPRNIDEFFDLYIGETLKGEGRLHSEIRLSEGNPPLALSLHHSKDQTHVTTQYPTYKIIESQKYTYLITEREWLRLPVAYGPLGCVSASRSFGNKKRTNLYRRRKPPLLIDYPAKT
jgi:hypothetical protein